MHQSAFEVAKAERDVLDVEVDAANAMLQTFPKGSMGCVPTAVKATPEYRAAHDRLQAAIGRLRAFDAAFSKKFGKELRAERRRMVQAIRRCQ